MVFILSKKLVYNQTLTHMEVLFKKSPVRPLEPPLSGHTHNDTEVLPFVLFLHQYPSDPTLGMGDEGYQRRLPHV